MKKEIILELIIDALQQDHSALQKAVDIACESATHAESKPENKYDTRGLEASYLAHGQAQRAAEIAMALDSYQQLAHRPLPQLESVGVGSLLQLEDEEGALRWLWLGAEAGGLTVSCDGQVVTVVTPQSPLGKVLIGKCLGDDVMVKIQGNCVEYEVISLY